MVINIAFILANMNEAIIIMNMKEKTLFKCSILIPLDVYSEIES